jgi:hypothetical protein
MEKGESGKEIAASPSACFWNLSQSLLCAVVYDPLVTASDSENPKVLHVLLCPIFVCGGEYPCPGNRSEGE